MHSKSCKSHYNGGVKVQAHALWEPSVGFGSRTVAAAQQVSER